MRAGAEDFRVLVARLEDGTPALVYALSGESKEEAQKKTEQHMALIFSSHRDIALIDLFEVTKDGIDWVDYREFPEEQQRYVEIEILCRTTLPKGSYYLRQPEPGMFSLDVRSVPSAPGSSKVFEMEPLSEGIVELVKQSLEKRKAALWPENRLSRKPRG